MPFAPHTRRSRSPATTDRVSGATLVPFVRPAHVGKCFRHDAVRFLWCTRSHRNELVTAFAQPDRRRDRVNGPRGTARYVGRGTYLRGPVGGRVGGENTNRGHTKRVCGYCTITGGAVRDERFCPGCRRTFGLGGTTAVRVIEVFCTCDKTAGPVGEHVRRRCRPGGSAPKTY